FFNLNDTLMVVGLVRNGPAEKAGLRVGDRITKIDTTQIAGRNIGQKVVDRLMRGTKGSVVNLYVYRDSLHMNQLFKVRRDQINVSSIDVSYLLEPRTGYVKLRRFGLKTAEEFRTALLELKKQGANQLILDLRDNGGGYFHIAIKVASEFFADKDCWYIPRGRMSHVGNTFPMARVSLLMASLWC